MCNSHLSPYFIYSHTLDQGQLPQPGQRTTAQSHPPSPLQLTCLGIVFLHDLPSAKRSTAPNSIRWMILKGRWLCTPLQQIACKSATKRRIELYLSPKQRNEIQNTLYKPMRSKDPPYISTSLATTCCAFDPICKKEKTLPKTEQGVAVANALSLYLLGENCQCQQHDLQLLHILNHPNCRNGSQR